MKVFTIKQNPSTEQIEQGLRQEFASRYAYRFFGIDRNRSIIVRKSEFIGAQISIIGNQITVHAITPNLLVSFVDMFLNGLIGGLFYAPLKKLEKDLLVFLKNKYA